MNYMAARGRSTVLPLELTQVSLDVRVYPNAGGILSLGGTRSGELALRSYGSEACRRRHEVWSVLRLVMLVYVQQVTCTLRETGLQKSLKLYFLYGDSSCFRADIGRVLKKIETMRLILVWGVVNQTPLARSRVLELAYPPCRCFPACHMRMAAVSRNGRRKLSGRMCHSLTRWRAMQEPVLE